MLNFLGKRCQNAILVYPFCLFLSAQAQYTNNYNWEFFGQLTEEAHRTFLDSQFVEYHLDSLDQSFPLEQGRIYLDTASRWQILFQTARSWTSVVGGETSSEVFPPEEVKIVEAYEKAAIYSGSDLLLGLNIDSFFISKDHNSIPLTVFEREHPFNRVWVPIDYGKFLQLRYVHSYPHGNQTSFYREYNFYFQKVERNR